MCSRKCSPYDQQRFYHYTTFYRLHCVDFYEGSEIIFYRNNRGKLNHEISQFFFQQLQGCANSFSELEDHLGCLKEAAPEADKSNSFDCKLF